MQCSYIVVHVIATKKRQEDSTNRTRRNSEQHVVRSAVAFTIDKIFVASKWKSSQHSR